MSSFRLVVIAAIAAPFVASAQSAGLPDSPVRAAEARFAAAAAKSASQAYLDMFDQDVVFLEPGERLARGVTAASAALSSTDPKSAGTATWQPITITMSADGKSGYAIGYGSLRGPFGEKDAPAVVPLKFIDFWRAAPNGEMKLVGAVRTFVRAAASATDINRREPAASCSAGPNSPALMIAADAQFAAHALNPGLGQATAEFVHPKGLILSGESFMVFGADSVRDAFESFPAGSHLIWQPTDGVIAASGDIGFTFGEARLEIPTGNDISTSYSKYLTVWCRSTDGHWRFVADGGNVRPKS